jgi:hypothetical protein
MTTRQDTLSQYFELVDEFIVMEALYSNSFVPEHRAKLQTAWETMETFREDNNISRQELTEATRGVKVESVSDIIRLANELLGEKHA